MQIKEGQTDVYKEWEVLNQDTEGFVQYVTLTADQIDAWVNDGLSLENAFKRMVETKPELLDVDNKRSVDTRLALHLYWPHGEKFEEYLAAQSAPTNEPTNNEPTAEAQ